MQHIRWRVLLTNRVLKINDDVIVTDHSLINLNKILYFCLQYTKRHLCAKFEQNRTRNKEVAKMENDIIARHF